MKVLVAFDKFKGSLTATEACCIAREALSAKHPDWTIDECPLADGGEGFADILTRASQGTFTTQEVTGPRGIPVIAPIGWVELPILPMGVSASAGLPSSGKLAIVDMASASGLALPQCAEPDIWKSHTIGTGQLLAAAGRSRPAAILLGVGGSATNDLGCGALAALGLNFLDNSARPVAPPIPGNWPRVTALSATPRSLPPLYIASDVTNPLLGPQGAAAVYGRQKGLRQEDRARLEFYSKTMADRLLAHFRVKEDLLDLPGSGAAGGLSFGLMAGYRATLLPGYDLIAQWLRLHARTEAADLVITGEGRFDGSSLQGKGPGSLVRAAVDLGKRVEVFAGQIQIPPQASRRFETHTVSPPEMPLPDAIAQARALLRSAVWQAF